MEFKSKLAFPCPDDFDIDNFDPNFVPENGEDYLKLVIYERRNIPKVVTSTSLPKNLKRPETIPESSQQVAKS